MKKTHRLLALLLSFVLVLTTLPAIPLEVQAAPYRDPRVTRDEAVGWAEYHASQRTAFDVDGIYGVQCSDLGSAYINWILTGNPINSPYNTVNGSQYFDLDYPEGWIKIRNTLEFVPEPGDILVWGEGYCPYGHVAIALSGCDTNRMRCVEQVGADYHIPTRINTISYKGFIGAVRPLWKNTVTEPPSKPNAHASKNEFLDSEDVVISWDRCSNTNWYDIEIVNNRTDEIVYTRNSTNTDSNTTFISTRLPIGFYRAKVVSVRPNGNGVLATASDYIYFNVVNDFSDAANLGDSFNALILLADPWKPIVLNPANNNVEVGTESTRAVENWHFYRNGDGSYTITSLYNNKVLDLKDSNTTNTTNILVFDSHGNNNQHWYIYPNQNAYRITTKLDKNKSLDSADGGTNPGNNIQIFDNNSTGAQKYAIYKINEPLPTGLHASDLTVTENSTANIQYNYEPANIYANAKGVIWSSSNTAVATIDNNGVVKGIKPGTATIKGILRYNDQISTSITVTVKKAPVKPVTKYTVSFIPNDGSGSMNSVSVNAGASYKLPNCGFNPPSADRYFEGWDVNGKQYQPGQSIVVNSNVTVKPIWHSHLYLSKWSMDSKYHWNECECGKYIHKAEHTYGDWKVVREATADRTGSKERSCTVCGYKQTAEIPKVSVSPHWEYTAPYWKYVTSDGSYAVGMQKIDKQYYYFNNNGEMLTGWQQVNGNWYYFNTSGHRLSGWQYIGNYYYYFNSDGVMQTGIISSGYILSDSGALLYNCWIYLDGYYYYADADGKAVKNTWKWINGNCYYFHNDGKMAVNETINGSHVNGSGAWVTDQWVNNDNGWWYQYADGSYPHDRFEKINGQWYYFDHSGYILTGWQKLNGNWYYFNDSGHRLSGWQYIVSYYYFFNSDGIMQTGIISGDYILSGSGALLYNSWIYLDGYYYYADDYGKVVRNTWKWINENCYYFHSDGRMAANETINGSYVNSSGAWVTDRWVNNSNGWWYQYSDGSYPHDKFEMINGQWYYFNHSGYILTGWQNINNNWYYFYSSGALAQDTYVDGYYVDKNGVYYSVEAISKIVEDHYNSVNNTDVYVCYSNETCREGHKYSTTLRHTAGPVANIYVTIVHLDVQTHQAYDAHDNHWTF